MKITKTFTCVALLACLATAANLQAGEKAVSNPFLGGLSTVASAELPAKAADLVAKASTKDRQQTTVDVVKAAIGLNPAAAPAVVGTISQAAPEMASVAAATAVSLVPNQVAVIARAAAAAAPKQAGKIVEAMCRVLPNVYSEVATAVEEVVPGAAKEILKGIAAAIPSMKDLINQSLVAYQGGTPSVTTVLDQVANGEKSGASKTPITSSPIHSITPVVNPPYVTPVATPANLDPGAGGQVPTGGRNYATP